MALPFLVRSVWNYFAVSTEWRVDPRPHPPLSRKHLSILLPPERPSSEMALRDNRDKHIKGETEMYLGLSTDRSRHRQCVGFTQKNIRKVKGIVCPKPKVWNFLFLILFGIPSRYTYIYHFYSNDSWPYPSGWYFYSFTLGSPSAGPNPVGPRVGDSLLTYMVQTN